MSVNGWNFLLYIFSKAFLTTSGENSKEDETSSRFS